MALTPPRDSTSRSHSPDSLFQARIFTPSKSLQTHGLGNTPVTPDSPVESDGDDVFQPPLKGKEVPSRMASPTPDLNDKSTPQEDQVKPDVRTIPDNPFDNEQSRILFDAIDQLQSWGSGKFLNIPQLVIVGSQSSGKSSLLQSLTDIPFPVGSGCCTRFPIRVVSRRTAPGTKDSFRIDVLEPEQTVRGLALADLDALEYSLSGETLTTENFSKALDDLSYNYMGIRKGVGADKKNFVANVVKIELSGPNRSQFSILDLPGTISSAHKVNGHEMRGVKEMVTKYMQQPENIVICVATATNDLENQEIFSMALEHVNDKKRLVGVLTKCDMLAAAGIGEVVATAIGETDDGGQAMEDGWFVVRNRLHDDPSSFDLDAEENKLFGIAPWTSISADRRGSKALKTHLGNILSSRVAEVFPNLERSIKSQLSTCLSDQSALGDPRDNHRARLQYLIEFVTKFERQAQLALEQPGNLSVPEKELRIQIRALSDSFNAFMRQSGHSFQFEDDDTDPREELIRILGEMDGKNGHKKPHRRSEYASELNHEELSDAGPEFHQFWDVGDSGELIRTIEQHLEWSQAAQLPGIVSPDVYPKVYRSQIQKWTGATMHYLDLARDRVENCFITLLDSTFPGRDGNSIAHYELKERLRAMLAETYENAVGQAEKYCQQETSCDILKTGDPRFIEQLGAWRRLRFLWAKSQVDSDEADGEDAEGRSRSKHFFGAFALLHHSTKENVIQDIQDVVRVYYQISLESFIRHITNSIIEAFVSHKDGPIRGLNLQYILNLSEEEVLQIAREDDGIIARREKLADDIKKLQGAQSIAHEARQKATKVSTKV